MELDKHKKPNYYAIIPAEVRYDDDLKANEKLLYGEITCLSNKEGFCWANNKYFARLYDVTTSTISRWISSLKSKGYVRVEVNKDAGNKRNIFIKNSRGIEDNDNRGFEENDNTPIEEKRKHNNIKNFNNINKDNMASASSEERKILKILKSIKKYPFNFKKDIENIRELMTDYPEVDFLKETKKWKTYKKDKPLKKNSNARLQLRNWMDNANKWQNKENENKNKANEKNKKHVDETIKWMKKAGVYDE